MPSFYTLKLCLILSLTGWLITTSRVNGFQSITLETKQLPTTPNRGGQAGEARTPGGRRSDSCPGEALPFFSINANNGADYTHSPYPTFVFYVPYGTGTSISLDFLLLTENERKTIYRTDVPLPDEPGLVFVPIPVDTENALTSGDLYRWYLNLDCVDDELEVPLNVDGWVRRIPADPTEIAWYDTIHDHAQAYVENPQEPQVQSSWRELLEELNFDDLVDVF